MAGTNDVTTLLKQALAAHNKGQYNQALLLYQRIVDADPDHAQAHHNLGAIHYEQDRIREAFVHFKTAFDLKKTDIDYQRGYGLALYATGDRVNAEKILRAVLAQNPKDMVATEHLIKLMMDTNRLSEALHLLKPYVSDGVVPKPEFLYYYCIILINLQRPDEAIAATRAVYEKRKNDLTYLRILGAILIKLSQYDEAVEIMRRTTELEPKEIGNWSNLCAACKGAYKFEEGIKAGEKALSMDPYHFDALSNLGVMYREMGEGEKGLSYLRRALELRPAYPNIHYNMGLNLVAAGYLREGWPESEWRWQTDSTRNQPRADERPQWEGNDIGTKKLCLFVDQGVGDTIQICRFLPEVRRRAPNAQIFVHCEPKLVPLLTAQFGKDMTILPFHITMFDDQGQYDYYHPLMSLLDTLSIDIDSIPGKKYLSAQNPKTYRDHPQQKVIGLSWHTKNLETGYKRSLTLDHFAFLKSFGEDVKIINLQYGDTTDARARSAANGLVIHHDETVDAWADLQPFIDQVAGCDLVISIDNTTVHVAGALGVPVWTLIPFVPYWRWTLSDNRTPWYDCMRFYRQPAPGEYGAVLERVEADLRHFVNGGSAIDETPYKLPVQPFNVRMDKPVVALLNAPSPLLPLEKRLSGDALSDALATGYIVDTILGEEIEKTPVIAPALTDFDLELYATRWAHANPSLVDRIRRADHIVVNGAGIFNGTDPLTLKTMYLAYFAAQRGKKLSIVNHSCFPEGGLELSDPAIVAYYLKIYKLAADITVIDPASQHVLAQLNIQARLVEDASSLAPLPKTPGGTGSHVPAFLDGFTTIRLAQLLDQIAPLLAAQGLSLALPVSARDRTGMEQAGHIVSQMSSTKPAIIQMEAPDDLYPLIATAAAVISNQIPVLTIAARLSKKILPIPGADPATETWANAHDIPMATIEAFNNINELTPAVFDNAKGADLLPSS